MNSSRIGRFWRILDSESVALFQVIYYAMFIVLGFQDLFIAHAGPRALHGSMSYLSIQNWCGALMVGSACGILGMLIYRYEPPEAEKYRPGRTLMLTGDITVGVAVVAYVLAVFHTEPWGTGGAGGYIGVAICLAMVFIVIRDIRRFSEHRFEVLSDDAR